jgi:hypothetical protein
LSFYGSQYSLGSWPPPVVPTLSSTPPMFLEGKMEMEQGEVSAFSFLPGKKSRKRR